MRLLHSLLVHGPIVCVCPHGDFVFQPKPETGRNDETTKQYDEIEPLSRRHFPVNASLALNFLFSIFAFSCDHNNNSTTRIATAAEQQQAAGYNLDDMELSRLRNQRD